MSGCSRVAFAVETVVMKRAMGDGESVVCKFVPTLFVGFPWTVCLIRSRICASRRFMRHSAAE